MKLFRPLCGAFVAAALALSLGACSEDADQPATTTATDAAPAPGDQGAAGFEEFPLGDEVEVGPLVVAGVYFQPVDMDPPGMGLSAAESNFHLEADIAAGPNDLGYGVGDFVPYLTVEYTIARESDNVVVAEGTFMPMNASDGPHYGANIALPDSGIYVVTFIIHSPVDQGNMLHTDPETGVTGSYWTTPLEAQWTWQYTPREW